MSYKARTTILDLPDDLMTAIFEVRKGSASHELFLKSSDLLKCALVNKHFAHTAIPALHAHIDLTITFNSVLSLANYLFLDLESATKVHDLTLRGSKIPYKRDDETLETDFDDEHLPGSEILHKLNPANPGPTINTRWTRRHWRNYRQLQNYPALQLVLQPRVHGHRLGTGASSLRYMIPSFGQLNEGYDLGVIAALAVFACPRLRSASILQVLGAQGTCFELLESRKYTSKQLRSTSSDDFMPNLQQISIDGLPYNGWAIHAQLPRASLALRRIHLHINWLYASALANLLQACQHLEELRLSTPLILVGPWHNNWTFPSKFYNEWDFRIDHLRDALEAQSDSLRVFEICTSEEVVEYFLQELPVQKLRKKLDSFKIDAWDASGIAPADASQPSQRYAQMFTESGSFAQARERNTLGRVG